MSSLSTPTPTNTANVVSRGYYKIEGAARAFNFVFKDKVVLDIGSSTGGFTEYALNHGAKKVIAVEKGSHQMKAPLRFDPRIELHEKTDIFEFPLSRDIDTVVADVSFISLTKILQYLKKLPNKNVDFLMMLKPQFEAKPYQLNKGIVKKDSTYGATTQPKQNAKTDSFS